MVAQGVARSMACSVTAAKSIGTHTEVLSYDLPGLSSLGPPNMPTTGQITTTISGISFWFTDAGRNGFTTCQATTWVSGTSLTCFAAQGVSNLQSVMATSGIAVGTLSLAGSYDSPISAIEPSNIKSNHGIVLVLGSDLGTMDTTIKGRLSSTGAEYSLWLSDTLMVCKSSTGIGSTLPVFATIGRSVDDLTQALSYDVPTLVSVFANSQGDVWSVNGINFGIIGVSQSNRVGFTQSLASLWQSDSSISCITASGHPVIRLITLTVGQSTASLTRPNVDAGISLSGVMQSNVASSHDSLIALMGKFFGLASYSGSVRVELSACQLTEWVSESTILCKISPSAFHHSASDGACIVTICGAASTLSLSFTYDLSRIFHTQTLRTKKEYESTEWHSYTSTRSQAQQ